MIERKLNTSCHDSFRFCTSVSNSLLSSKPILSGEEMSIKTEQRIVFQTLHFLRNLGFIAFSSSNQWFLNILCCLGNGHLYCTYRRSWLDNDDLSMVVFLPYIYRIGKRLVFLPYKCRMNVVATSELISKGLQSDSWCWSTAIHTHSPSFHPLSTHLLSVSYWKPSHWFTYTTVHTVQYFMYCLL